MEGAVRPMIDDGRIKAVTEVKIVEQTTDAIYVQVTIDIGPQLGTITYEVTF